MTGQVNQCIMYKRTYASAQNKILELLVAAAITKLFYKVTNQIAKWIDALVIVCYELTSTNRAGSSYTNCLLQELHLVDPSWTCICDTSCWDWCWARVQVLCTVSYVLRGNFSRKSGTEQLLIATCFLSRCSPCPSAAVKLEVPCTNVDTELGGSLSALHVHTTSETLHCSSRCWSWVL